MEFSWTSCRAGFNERIASGELKIAHGAWLGHNVAVVPPTRRIGIGAVVRAGSVVCTDVPDYAIVSGFPARVVGWRIPKDRIPVVLASQWWERSPGQLGGCRAEPAGAAPAPAAE